MKVTENNGTYYLIQYILGSLFSAEERRLYEFEMEMFAQNKRLVPTPMDGMIYMGKVFRPKGWARGKPTLGRVHESLHDEMDAHLKDKQVIEDDKKEISQLLHKLLDNCFSDQDIRDAIPESIVDVLAPLKPEAMALERRRQPSHFLHHGWDFKLYEEVLLKIKFYSAARLLY